MKNSGHKVRAVHNFLARPEMSGDFGPRQIRSKRYEEVRSPIAPNHSDGIQVQLKKVARAPRGRGRQNDRSAARAGAFVRVLNEVLKASHCLTT